MVHQAWALVSERGHCMFVQENIICLPQCENVIQYNWTFCVGRLGHALSCRVKIFASWTCNAISKAVEDFPIHWSVPRQSVSFVLFALGVAWGSSTDYWYISLGIVSCWDSCLPFPAFWVDLLKDNTSFYHIHFACMSDQHSWDASRAWLSLGD